MGLTLFAIAEVMNFGGSAPELTNARLAMVGFVAAMGAELASGVRRMLRSFLVRHMLNGDGASQSLTPLLSVLLNATTTAEGMPHHSCLGAEHMIGGLQAEWGNMHCGCAETDVGNCL